MKLIKIAFLILLAPLFLITSCATIMNGTTQEICIDSQPTAAQIFVDNQPYGTSPVILDLDRSENHIIRIELEGYEPHQIYVKKKMSKWVFGNILFGGFIGLAVDACSGGIYKLTPDQVHAQLQATNSDIAKNGDGFITVVTQVDPSWEKIGNVKQK